MNRRQALTAVGSLAILGLGAGANTAIQSNEAPTEDDKPTEEETLTFQRSTEADELILGGGIDEDGSHYLDGRVGDVIEVEVEGLSVGDRVDVTLSDISIAPSRRGSASFYSDMRLTIRVPETRRYVLDWRLDVEDEVQMTIRRITD